MKYLKKILLLAVLLIALLPCQTQAASTRSKAVKAYRKFLSGSTMTWRTAYNEKKTVSLSKCKFAIAYVDKDSVPELIVSSGDNMNAHTDGYYLLYTYKNGKVTFVANTEDSFSYYRKKGVFRATRWLWGSADIVYFKLSKGKATQTYYEYEEGSYDYNDNGVSDHTYAKITKAKIPYEESSTKKISKKTFTSQLKKLIGSTKKTIVKTYYPNTAANRKKILK